jgi:hypothetical protein
MNWSISVHTFEKTGVPTNKRKYLFKRIKAKRIEKSSLYPLLLQPLEQAF